MPPPPLKRTAQFQFTRPRGARLARSIPLRDQPRFNSRAREGRDVPAVPLEDGRLGFNSRPRERDVSPRFQRQCKAFNSHAPRRDANNTPTRRHLGHTRPRGARLPAGTSGQRQMCFNSRAREGRDVWRGFVGAPWKCFNSRAREGRDAMAELDAFQKKVSIHAPARGATPSCPIAAKTGRFQFTRPRGDVALNQSQSRCGAFQFRAPARGDSAHRPSAPSVFQPRARGRDVFHRCGRCFGMFIHAPASATKTSKMAGER